MKSRTLGLLVISLIAGLAAAFLANQWLQQRLAPATEQAGPPMESIVIAALDINFGDTIEQRHLKLLYMPEGSAPSDVLRDPKDALGKIAKDAMLAGDMLRGARLAEHLGGSTLASLVEPTKRAITVRVDDVVGVAGFLLPGNRVDILATRRTGERAQAETILYDLRVLAVDQTASTDKTQPVVVRAVTLEMDPQQAEVLVKAQSEGRLQLSLRNPLDKSLPEPPAPAPVAPAAAPVTKPVVKRPTNRGYGITIIRGTDVEVAKVKM